MIPERVTSIGKSAFSPADSLTIYAGVLSKPSGWNENLNLSNIPVYWKGQWHNDSNGNPTPN